MRFRAFRHRKGFSAIRRLKPSDDSKPTCFVGFFMEAAVRNSASSSGRRSRGGLPHAILGLGALVDHAARRCIRFATGWSEDPVRQPAAVELVHRLIKRCMRFWCSERFRGCFNHLGRDYFTPI
jgi:hypothetical protein